MKRKITVQADGPVLVVLSNNLTPFILNPADGPRQFEIDESVTLAVALYGDAPAENDSISGEAKVVDDSLESPDEVGGSFEPESEDGHGGL